MRFFVAYGEDETTPRAIFPLRYDDTVVRRLRVRAFSLPHHAHLPLADFVVEPSPPNRRLLPALLRYLRSLPKTPWDVLFLPNTLEDSAVAYLVSAVAPRRHLAEPRKGCDYVPCTQPYEALRSGYTKSLRSNLKSYQNRLTREGSPAEYVFARTPGELNEAFTQFLAVEGSGWKGASGERSAIQLRPELVAFYRALIRRFGAQGDCEIQLLRLGGRCIAAGFHLRTDRTDYSLKIGYDEERKALSPGSLLLDACLRRFCENDEIDVANMVSDSEWQLAWGTRRLMVSDHWIVNLTARGAAAIVLLRARGVARVLWRRTALTISAVVQRLRGVVSRGRRIAKRQGT